MHKKTMVQAFGLALTGLFAAGAAMAADGQQQAAPQGVSAQNSQVTFIDPATGKRRAPTAAEVAKLNKMIESSRAAQGVDRGPRTMADAHATLRTLKLRSGRTVTGMDVPESLSTRLVAERAADGSYRIHHEGETSAAAVEVTK
ncbi:hypothetical protein ASG87_00375 [Frateuria sp. Soil773]|uniref:post-PEP-CTERM-1 domain-containing protein n=1 Tax=Frateuria sp. Soil773 TaxID=1736407 RepID=UPI0006F86231|nr:hypothetical protein [Frateuria sp. Soil773]KRE92413.1 hypothetical protein ASG87_00375 [Frateuria sp. Soil773]